MVSVTIALACATLAFVLQWDWLTTKLLHGARPLMAGTLAGLIFGDVTAGLIIGSLLELMAMGVYTYGGASTPDYIGGAIIGTAIAVTNPTMATAAVAALAIGIAVLFSPFDIMARTFNTFFMHLGDRYAEKLDFRKLEITSWLGLFPWGLSRAIPTFIGVLLVEDAVAILGLIPENVMAGFAVAGLILPALGIGMLLRVMPTRKYLSYGIIGFVIAAYLNFILPATSLKQTNFMGTITVGLTLIGVSIALIVLNMKYGEDALGGATPREKAKEKRGKTLTPKDLRGVFMRYYLHFQLSWNYERMQGFDYFHAIRPALQKIYDKTDDLKEMVKMHMSFFNTNALMAPIVMGADLAIEEEKGIASKDLILAIKTGTMGPLAGIGDTLVFATINTILMSLGVAWGAEGNLLGFFFVLIVSNCIYIPLRYYGFKLGYREGLNVAKTLGSDVRIKRVTEFATIIGMIVVGGLIPIFVRVGFVAEFAVAGVAIPSIQHSLDSIFPFILPALLVGLVYFMLQKSVKPSYVMLALFAIGIAGGTFGILG